MSIHKWLSTGSIYLNVEAVDEKERDGIVVRYQVLLFIHVMQCMSYVIIFWEIEETGKEKCFMSKIKL